MKNSKFNTMPVFITIFIPLLLLLLFQKGTIMGNGKGEGCMMVLSIMVKNVG